MVKHLRNNGVAIGPGRGRCVSSLAAYALGITGVDPVRHGLLAESFVSANRLSPPVFYINVGIGGKRKATAYLQSKYGTDGDEAALSSVVNIEESAAITHLHDCLAALGKDAPDLDNIPLEDSATIALFANGETEGFPLFDSDDIKNWLRELKPRRFSDIVTAFAIYDIARKQDAASLQQSRAKHQGDIYCAT